MLALTALVTGMAAAGGLQFENEEGDYLRFGGRIQLQYHLTNPDGGSASRKR